MNFSTLFQDFRGQMSWGRVSSFVALSVAVWGQFHNLGIEHLHAWLGLAGAGYGLSKGTEAFCDKGK